MVAQDTSNICEDIVAVAVDVEVRRRGGSWQRREMPVPRANPPWPCVGNRRRDRCARNCAIGGCKLPLGSPRTLSFAIDLTQSCSGYDDGELTYIKVYATLDSEVSYKVKNDVEGNHPLQRRASEEQRPSDPNRESAEGRKSSC